MTLTINYKNGEFTCTFTPEGDPSIQIIGPDGLTVNLENQDGLGREDAAKDVVTTVWDQENYPVGTEEYPQEAEYDAAPASASHMTETYDNGQSALSYGYNE